VNVVKIGIIGCGGRIKSTYLPILKCLQASIEITEFTARPPKIETHLLRRQALNHPGFAGGSIS